MMVKNVSFDVNEKFYNVTERPKKEIEVANKVYKALKTLKDYCINCDSCKDCIMKDMCDSIPMNWEI